MAVKLKAGVSIGLECHCHTSRKHCKSSIRDSTHSVSYWGLSGEEAMGCCMKVGGINPWALPSGEGAENSLTLIQAE